jgi:hypothetical protein
MSRRRLGGVVIAIGVAVLLVSALADKIGIGEGGAIGWKQVTGMTLGGAVIVVGLAVFLFAGRSPDEH